jgi:uncharacterized membrane protein YGL010W
MYHFKICNRIKLVYFLKFIVHKINSKMIKSKMMMLTEREKSDVVIGWILQHAARTVMSEKREKTDMMWTKVR